VNENRFYLVTWTWGGDRHQKLLIADGIEDAKAEFIRQRREFAARTNQPELLHGYIIVALQRATDVAVIKGKRA
jgi:hypothetical protein